jgi:hypothetical protein
MRGRRGRIKTKRRDNLYCQVFYYKSIHSLLESIKVVANLTELSPAAKFVADKVSACRTASD